MKKIEKQLKKSAKLLPSMQKKIILPDGIELLNKIHKNVFYRVALAALSIGICFGITLSVGAQVGEKVVSFFANVTNTEPTPTEQSSMSDTSSEIVVEPTPSQEQASSKAETYLDKETSINEGTSSDQPINSNPTSEKEYEDTPLGKMVKGEGYHTYELKGAITDWFVEGELIHTVFKNDNYYMVFDAGSGQLVFDCELIAKPDEIHSYGDEIWISYPDLKCIKIYDKNTFTEKSTINLQNKVSSFDVYGDYIVYTEKNQRTMGYRYNLKNSQIDAIKPDTGNVFFSETDVLVNSKLGVVYISNSNSTGSNVYCYDIETLKLKSTTPFDIFGYVNFVRRSFLVDDSFYWSSYEVDSTDVSKITARYWNTYSTGMLYVDKRFVVTTEGIYLRKTHEQIVSGQFDEYNSAVAITDSGNIFVTELSKLYIFSNDSLESQGILKIKD